MSIFNKPLHSSSWNYYYFSHLSKSHIQFQFMECSSLRNLSCECLLFCVYCVCLSWSKSKVWGITQPSNEISKISKISQLLSSLKATFIFFVFVVPYSTKERIWFLRKSLHIFLLFGSSNSNNHVSIMLLFNVTFLGARKRFKIFFPFSIIAVYLTCFHSMISIVSAERAVVNFFLLSFCGGLNFVLEKMNGDLRCLEMLFIAHVSRPF